MTQIIDRETARKILAGLVAPSDPRFPELQERLEESARAFIRGHQSSPRPPVRPGVRRRILKAPEKKLRHALYGIDHRRRPRKKGSHQLFLNLIGDLAGFWVELTPPKGMKADSYDISTSRNSRFSARVRRFCQALLDYLQAQDDLKGWSGVVEQLKIAVNPESDSIRDWCEQFFNDVPKIPPTGTETQ